MRAVVLPSSSETRATSDIGSCEAPWLNSDFTHAHISPAIIDVDRQAVTHLFSSWTLYPCNHHISPGHFQDLPLLYESSFPGGALRLATESLAYAELPGQHLKAQSRYGAALARVREVTDDPGKNRNDTVLAALLVIDNFEVRTHFLLSNYD